MVRKFGTDDCVDLLGTIKCQSKDLLACKLFIVIFARQASVNLMKFGSESAATIPLWHEGIFLPEILRLRQLP